MKPYPFVILLFLAALLAVTPPPFTADRKTETLRVHEEVFAQPFDEDRLKKYLESLPRDGAYFVIEGDILLTEQEVRAYVVARSLGATPIGPELVVNVFSGKRDYWERVAKRHLTYAVDRKSFPSDNQYQVIVNNMRDAAQEWQDACPDCQVRYTHLQQYDLGPSHDHVTFIVRYHDTGGVYLATAFFPSFAPLRRYVNIDPAYFTTAYDKIGVLRHELGHTLGYHHEHIRGIAGCVQEGAQWHPLTPYDPKSVMHYFCGNAGDLLLSITELDRIGHRRLYGQPTR